MAHYKVTSPLYVSSLKKLFQPGDDVELAGEEEKVALHYRAVVAVPNAQPVTPVKPLVTSAPVAPAKPDTLVKPATSASSTSAKSSDAK